MPSLPPSTIATDTLMGPLGFVLRTVEPGRSVWEYQVSPAHYNPNGTLHGGVIMALLDTAMGVAITAQIIGDGKRAVVAEMSTRFLAPVRSGLLRAEAQVIKAGKRLAVIDARVTDEGGKLIAAASATHAILP